MKYLTGFLFFVLLTHTGFSQERLSLAGSWCFRLDPDGKEMKQDWYQNPQVEHIQLPGTTDQAKKGTKTQGADYGILSRAYKYIGPAWYSREIDIPSGWKGKEIELFLERVMWESKVWLDGVELSKKDALAVPHVHSLGVLKPGKHRLTLRINNDLIYNIGDKGHAYTEYTQSIWNGVVGKIELQAKAKTQLTDLRVFADAKKKQLELKLKLQNPAPMNVVYTIVDLQTNKLVFSKQLRLGNEAEQVHNLKLDFPIKLWDEFEPNRYQITARLQNKNQIGVDFGFRSISRSTSKILINDAPVFMRGNLDCVHFPLTGYPSCDVTEWERIFRIYKSYGLNHVRFHSWCPPEAAFIAADKLGIYIQAEMIWIDWWMTEPPKDRPDMLTKGLPQGLGHNPSADQFVQDELQRIVKAYGNHPSFTMLCIGNELGNSDFSKMQEWIRKIKDKDARRLYALSTARKITPVDDFSATHNIPNAGGTYGLKEAGTDYDLEKNYSKSNIPIIAHEVGQFPVYPLWTEIDKYTGVLKARNLELCKTSAVANGLDQQDAVFHKASGALQKILYKALIENFYRTPSCAGFQMLSMQDYQGQGEALVGWLDAFYDDKGTTAAPYFKQYNNEVVPLARFKKFIWQNTEDFVAKLQVANYGSGDLKSELKWTLTDESNQLLGQGTANDVFVKRGEVKPVMEVRLPLIQVAKATKAKFVLTLPGTAYHNEWEIWIYPEHLPSKSSGAVTETDRLDEKTLQDLQNGKNVLLYASKLGQADGFRPVFFEPLFWSNVFFPGQENTTLGTSINAQHPVFNDFPTDFYSDWQWEAISKGGRSFKLKKWPQRIRPMAQPISDFHLNEKLGSLFECKVGKGKLLVCGYDVQTVQNPVAGQFRYSLRQYMSGEAFNPEVSVDTALLKATFPLVKQAESKIPVPAAFSEALLYSKAGTSTSVLKRNTRFKFTGAKELWQWDGKEAWYGKKLEMEINPPQGVIGELYLHFEDWNNEGRDAKIWIEGRAFATGKLDKAGKWIKLFVMREDTNDGKVNVKIESVAGSNAMISEVVFVETK
ncbi:glycoside hydrolase family 2 [Pedobacter sp. HMWF019]|uniref:sugar-binding domain-containing protein n=1 Tax=Pedobacter sp. HMWF019 TaxID=2056856 RepID=UPI000D367A18|nr:sugar-binding domain-containing protein [Pedobacter sp. HMWF019]PTS99048.1 glycoside hydrolase family 2 [Pedobacter sp. HMWF019]